MEVTARLAAALDDLVRADAAAAAAPGDRQAARRAIEQATIVARHARDEGVGPGRVQGQMST